MEPSEGRLRYRKKGGLAWRELTAGAMPDHGEVWEVQSPDGSIALLSRSDAPLPAAPPSADETDSFHLTFAQQGSVAGHEPAPAGDLPVFRIRDIEKTGPSGPPACRVARPADLADPGAFGVLMEGDALAPKYASGQIVLVDSTLRPGEGEWAVVCLAAGDARIARWLPKRGGKILLDSPGAPGKPLEVAANQIRFAHKIVWAREP